MIKILVELHYIYYTYNACFLSIVFFTELHLYHLEPGTLMFQKRGVLVKESVGDATITVIRKNGADGEVSVKWRTIDKTAIEGKDYHGKEGVLVFKHTEVG